MNHQDYMEGFDAGMLLAELESESPWTKITDKFPEDRQECFYRTAESMLHAGNYYTYPHGREGGYFVHNNGTGYEPATDDMEWMEVPG